MNIIEEVKGLNLPEGKHVVIGSGILDVLGIREARDIDIAVTEDVYKGMRDMEGWEEKKDVSGKYILEKNNISILQEIEWENFPRTTAQVIRAAEVIKGIPFMNLRELIAFKAALGREKDKEDIRLIVRYLSQQE